MKNHLPIVLAALGAPLLLAACRPSSSQAAAADAGVQRALAVLVPIGGDAVSGEVRFERVAGGVHVTGTIRGLQPGQHGFHVHEFGDLSDDAQGASAGGHFAPEGHRHGRRTDDERHVGDLGNIEAGADGTATIDLTDEVLALSGEHSILGRALVVHAEPDTFAQPSGAAGGRVAFGVIGIAGPPQGQGAGS